jgi:hypothetical protein
MGVTAAAMSSKAEKFVAKAKYKDAKSDKLISPPRLRKVEGEKILKFIVRPADASEFEIGQVFKKESAVKEAHQSAKRTPRQPKPKSRLMSAKEFLAMLPLPTCGAAGQAKDSTSVDDDRTFASINIMGRRFRFPDCGPIGSTDGDDKMWAKFDEEVWDDCKAKDEISWMNQPEEFFSRGLCGTAIPFRDGSDDDDNQFSRRVTRWKKNLKVMRGKAAKDGQVDANSLPTVEEGTFEGSNVGTLERNNSYEDETFDDTLENTLENTLEDTLYTLRDTEGNAVESESDSLTKSLGSVCRDSINAGEGAQPESPESTPSVDRTPIREGGPTKPANKSESVVVQPPYAGEKEKCSPRSNIFKLSRASKDESPRGVHDFIDTGEKEEATMTISQTLMGMITCKTRISTEDIFFDEASGARNIPHVLIREAAEDASVGDLTATTHEMRVDIESFKQKLISDKETPKILPVRKVTELLGCSIRKPIVNTTMMSELPAKTEDYFSEYDDYSFLSPKMAAAAETAWARRNVESNRQAAN